MLTDNTTSRTGQGVVDAWHAEDGWGVIAVENVRVWAHFSVVATTGYRSLAPGDEVDVEYSARPVDGFDYSASSIRPRGGGRGGHGASNQSDADANPSLQSAMSSRLIIRRDDSPAS